MATRPVLRSSARILLIIKTHIHSREVSSYPIQNILEQLRVEEGKETEAK